MNHTFFSFSMRHLMVFFLSIIGNNVTFAQSTKYSYIDTLRGSITPERAWWDLQHYCLELEIDPDSKSIRGSNCIRYKVLQSSSILQIDLQPPLKPDSIVQDGRRLQVVSRGPNAMMVALVSPQPVDAVKEVTVYYSGKPREARWAPWDGGFSWSKDATGAPFVATSCQGLGASVWWPCKDHMYDEPDSMVAVYTVPKPLVAVGNGRLLHTVDNGNGWHSFTWRLSNPINNYGVNCNIGRYAHWSDIYQGEKGELTLDFYALQEDREAAAKQFVQVKNMLRAFEHWFGPYPFYEDGYKLVQVPYLGMEHQSSVTYGNKFKNGYLGTDLSGTGWGLKWDYIIIHESGHEWFANNITYRDIADMWIHEGFTTYSEALFTEFMFGKEAGAAYVRGQRDNIRNESPIIGDYDVNDEGSGDMYYKGANMLHTLRQWVNNDSLWRTMLRGLNKTFYHQTVTTGEIEGYISEQTGLDLQLFFDQYLRTNTIPRLEIQRMKRKVRYRWTECVPGFAMPVRMLDGQREMLWTVTTEWQEVSWKNRRKMPRVSENYYVRS
jgi:aminopeptidase N